MPKDDRLLRRHIIAIVVQLDAGNLRIGIELEDLPRQPSAVGVVGNQIPDECPNSDQQRSHRLGLLLYKPAYILMYCPAVIACANR